MLFRFRWQSECSFPDGSRPTFSKLSKRLGEVLRQASHWIPRPVCAIDKSITLCMCVIDAGLSRLTAIPHIFWPLLIIKRLFRPTKTNVFVAYFYLLTETVFASCTGKLSSCVRTSTFDIDPSIPEIGDANVAIVTSICPGNTGCYLAQMAGWKMIAVT